MLPKEHGAYGQLLLPAATAAALGRPSFAAFAIVGCAAAAFVAHEPALVLLGRRGERARRDCRRQARRWIAGSTAAAIVLGAAAVVLTAGPTRWLLAVPFMFGSIAAVVMLGGRERSAAGEVAVSTALASVSLPVAAVSGATPMAALTCAATFAAGFAAATVSVRAVIAAARGPSRGERSAAFAADVLLLAAVAALTVSEVILPVAIWAALPVCGVALALAAVVPPPRYLRQIGWTLVLATSLSGGILIAAVR